MHAMVRRSTYVLAVALVLGVSPVAKAVQLFEGIDPLTKLFSLFTLTVTSSDHSVPTFDALMADPPIGPGNAVIILNRLGGLADGATGPIPLQVLALSLQSAAPVNVGGSFFDVFVTINAAGLPGLPQPDTLTPSTGITTILTNGPGGGTFTSTFDIFADVLLEPVGQPGVVAAHFAATKFTEALQGQWFASDPCFPLGPISGNFCMQSVTVTSGPLPLVPILPVPEPATAALLGVGLAGLAAARGRRQHV